MSNSPPTIRFSSHGGLSDLWRGLSLPVIAARLISRTPELRSWSRIAAMVTGAVLVAWLTVLALWTDDLLARLWPQPAQGVGHWAWLLAVGIAFCLLAVLGATTLPLLFLAPLLDPLSEATERAIAPHGHSPPPGSLGRALRGAAVALGHTLKRVALLWVGQLALLPLLLIPGLGGAASALLGMAWTALWLAAEYVDLPMARHLHSFSEVLAVLRRRRWATAGFGLSLYLLLWVPVLNLFLVPIAAVAGTLYYRAVVDSSARPRS